MFTPSAEGYKVTKSGPQNGNHMWVYANRQDIESTLSAFFGQTQVNRVVNKIHTFTFGKNAIKNHFFALGITKAHESMFSRYSYEQRSDLTDDKHRREQDTSTWFVVA